MELAYQEAKKGKNRNEVPIGALIVKDGKILSRSHNSKITDFSPIAHAEINCILKACKIIGSWRLDDCELYVTMEPCSMCKEVIKETRIKTVYYLTKRLNYKKNYAKTKYLLFDNKSNLTLNNEYQKLLKEFFLKLR